MTAPLHGQSAPADRSDTVGDLYDVLANPLRYEGRKFRGYVYVYPAPGYYALSPRPLPNAEIEKFDITFLPGKGQDLNAFRLKAGDRLLIRGRLALMLDCFGKAAVCVPFFHPIDIDDLRVLGISYARRHK